MGSDPESSATEAPAGRRDKHTFDAFVSYSRQDVELATRLQTELGRLTKPWYRRRALHVFRDQTSLSAGARLWSPIERALAGSGSFILVASPAAAASPWVARELEWWLANRSVDDLILVVASGDLVWSSETESFDPTRSDCLPSAATSCFSEEPHWVDVRPLAPEFDRDRLLPYVASVMAAVTGKAKEDLLSEDLHQHRRVKRLAIGVAVVFCLLSALLTVVARQAYQARNDAVEAKNHAQELQQIADHEAAVAEAHAMAGTSQAYLDSRLDRALQLASDSYEKSPDFSSRSALFRALTHDPHLVRFIHLGHVVKQVTWAGSSGQLVAAGDHYLATVDPGTGAVVGLNQDKGVSAVASSLQGDTFVVGSNDGQVSMFSPDSATPVWTRVADPSPSGVKVAAMAIDAQRHRVITVSRSGYLAILASSDGRLLAHGRIVPADPDVPLSYLGLVDDGSTLVIGDKLGGVTVSSADRPLTVTARKPSVEGLYRSSRVPRAYVATDHSVVLGWPDKTTYQVSVRHGSAQVPHFPLNQDIRPTSFALSDDLGVIAADTRGTLTISRAKSAEDPKGFRFVLPGAPSVNAHLSFSPDGTMLAVASGANLSVWRVEGLAGIAGTLPTSTPGDQVMSHPSSILSKSSTRTLVTIEPRTIADESSATATMDCWSTDEPQSRERVSVRLPGVDPLTALSWAHGKRQILAATGSMSTGRARVYVLDTREGCPGQVLRSFPMSLAAKDYAVTVRGLADGSLVVCSFFGALIHLRPDGSTLQEWPQDRFSDPDSVRAVAVSPRGDALVVGLQSGRLQGYRLEGTMLRPSSGWPSQGGLAVVAVVYCRPDLVAYSRLSGVVTLANADDGAKIATLGGAQGFNLATAGRRSMVVGTEPDHQAAVWSIDTRGLMTKFSFAPVTSGELRTYAKRRNDRAMSPALASNGAGGLWFGVPTAYVTFWNFGVDAWHSCALVEAGLPPPVDTTDTPCTP